jgi:hypothetical protein
MGKDARILCISDLHAPFGHRDTIPFLKELKKKHKPTRIVLLGDEVDGHAWSYHEQEPDAEFTPTGELLAAIEEIQKVYALFPVADVLDSNHGSLAIRKAKSGKLPYLFLRPMREVLKTPRWSWTSKLVLKSGSDIIGFMHGKSAAFLKWANSAGISTVEGHFHTKQG